MKKYFIEKFGISYKVCKNFKFFLFVSVAIFTNNILGQTSGVFEVMPPKASPLKFSISCNKVYASGYSGGRDKIYELNGATMTPVYTAPQNVGGLSISANGNAYYDNGTFVSSPVYSSDLVSQINTGATFNSLMAGQVADATGNVYYVDTSRHLRKNVFGGVGSATDLGAILFDSADTIGPTVAFGDMAMDGNGRLYWYSSVGAFGESYLYVIDLATLRATSLGHIGPDEATGLAFDATGKLITTSNSGTTVISVDLSSPTLQETILGTATPSVFDLGSCAAPFFNPILNAFKSVANITSGVNPATIAQPNDILEYTIIVTNTGNIISNNSLFVDAIPALTTYVPNSTTVDGLAVADVGGNMPFSIPGLINSLGQLPGIINVSSPVTIKFKVTVDLNAIGLIPNTATISYPTTMTGVTTTQNVNSNTVIVSVNPIITIDDIKIYNHFTPNGDGENEMFFIEGIESFPNNKVEIYNRWGVLVYETEGYNNADKSFKGESNGRITIKQKEQLPEGTYYYTIKYAKSSGQVIEKSSYLYINR